MRPKDAEGIVNRVDPDQTAPLAAFWEQSDLGLQFLPRPTCPKTWIITVIYELPHDKTNKMTVRPAKTQISLGICLV